MRAVAVIPARYASTRFPGKPLAPLLGRPMIAWVIEAAAEARRIEEVWVATDHDGIAEEARRAGARAAMTSADCPSGTDRVAEAVRGLSADVIVNLQGDEPLVETADLDALVESFRTDAGLRMATLARPLHRPEEFGDPDVVKVVCDGASDALYFSRAPIPCYRDAGPGRVVGASPTSPLVHLGLYAFIREALFAFTELPRGRLEEIEKLEQLRALEAGWKIRVLPARTRSVGVDRPEDLVRAEQALRARLDPERLGC